MKIETPVLRRLGPVPFWRGEKRCFDALEEIYRKVCAGATERLDPCRAFVGAADAHRADRV